MDDQGTRMTPAASTIEKVGVERGKVTDLQVDRPSTGTDLRTSKTSTR